jgi:hypothetical protein
MAMPDTYTILSQLISVAVDNERSLMDELMRGEWYTAVVSVYTQTLGPLFHVLVFLLGPTLIGIKYQRFAPVAMAVLVSGVVFAMFFDAPLQFLFAVVAIFGLAGVLYSVVSKS